MLPSVVATRRVRRRPPPGRGPVGSLVFGVSLALALFAPSSASADVARDTYPVQPGETLGGIADAVGIPIRRLAALNNLANPDVIRAGQVLRLSGGQPPGERGGIRPAPVARRVGSPNYWPGRPHGPPIALVVHTMAGRLVGADAWFADPRSQVSAHYGVGLDGRIHQYVGLQDRAWANGATEPGSTWPGPAGLNPNHLTVSIEVEDRGDPGRPMTEAQYRGVLAAGRLALSRYPQIRYLVTHRAISPRSRPDDPGRRWMQRDHFARLAAALGLKAVT